MTTPSLSSPTLAFGRPTLADRVFARGLAVDIVLIAAGAGLTALAAHVIVPLWPVPVTGQTLAVLLVGSALGAARGALSMVVYAMLGLAGLPVFAPQDDGSHLTGALALASPSFGYIVGFIAAAALTGWLAQLEWDRKVLRAFVAFLAGSVVTFAIGLPWLSVSLGALGYSNGVAATLESGLYPFIIGGVVKAALGAGIMALAWRSLRHGDSKP